MITTLANVKAYKNISDATHDVELTRILLAVEQFMVSECGRVFEGDPALVEYQSARSDQRVLIVERPPINSIASLYDDPLRTYGAAALIPTTDYVIENADAGIIVLDGRSFNKGLNNIKLSYSGGFLELAAPAAPTVTPQGAAGAVAYSYKVTALTARGETEASLAGSTAAGNATLTGTNFNRLTWAAVTGALGYRVYRTVPTGSKGFLKRVTGLTYDDTGQAVADGVDAPTQNRTGIPNDLQQAACELTWMCREKGDKSLLGMRAKSIGEGSVSVLDLNWPSGVQNILNLYRHWNFHR